MKRRQEGEREGLGNVDEEFADNVLTARLTGLEVVIQEVQEEAVILCENGSSYSSGNGKA